MTDDDLTLLFVQVKLSVENRSKWVGKHDSASRFALQSIW
jgi:hypothetical protein